MNILKKALCLLLAAMLLVPAMPLTASADDVKTLTIQELREKFPAGKYWNHADAPGAGSEQNNQDGWTDIPCGEHGNLGTDSQTCNAFQPVSMQLSWQCMGYAEKLGYDATGYNPRLNANGWYTYTDASALETVKPGDIVRFRNHSIYIIGVDGDVLTYTDCNSDGHCVIRWDATITRQALAANFVHLRSAPGEGQPDCGCSASYAGTYRCVTQSGGLNVRSGHGAEFSWVGSIPQGAEIHVSRADGQWAHVQYGDIHGFASMAYLELIAPDETVPVTEPATEPATQPTTEPATEPTEPATEPTVPGECACSEDFAGYYVCTATTSSLRIRSGHGTDHPQVGSIPPGAAVYVSKASGGGPEDWAHVTYNGVSGYASMGYLEKKEEGVAPSASRVSYQVRLIEPWGMKINVRFTDGEDNTLDLAAFSDWGAFAIRRGQLDDPSAPLSSLAIEDIVENPAMLSFRRSDGSMVSNGKYVSFVYNTGLYTYRLSENVVWVAYYEDAQGRHYTALRERNLSDLIHERMNGSPEDFGDYERAVYAAMARLEGDITDYRSGFQNPSDIQVVDTDTLAETEISFDPPAEDGKYLFSRALQICLIEPWGIRQNVRAYDAALGKETHLNYDALEDYGVLFYHDRDGTLSPSQMDGWDDFLGCPDRENVYVFSKSQGTVFLKDSFFAANFNRDIFTYQLDSNLYTLSFIKVDGKFYYSRGYCTNIRELAETRGDDLSDVFTQKERLVYKSMVALCGAVTAYRDDYFSKHP